MNLTRPAPIALVLAIACAGTPIRAQEAAAASNLNPLHDLAKSKLTGFKDRPLFNPSRMEPPAPLSTAPAVVAAPPPPPEPPPDLHLVGIVSGSRDLAILHTSAGGKTVVLATGDKIGAWSVTVRPDGVRLQDDARSVDLMLFNHAGVAPATAPVPGGSVPSVKGPDAFPPTGDPSP